MKTVAQVIFFKFCENANKVYYTEQKKCFFSLFTKTLYFNQETVQTLTLTQYLCLWETIVWIIVVEGFYKYKFDRYTFFFL